MWIIDDEKAREFAVSIIPEEEISDAYEYQKDNSNDYAEVVAYEGLKAEVRLRVKKALFKKSFVYKPTCWNPYPQIKPPKRGYYLVTRLLKRVNGETYKYVDVCLFGMNKCNFFLNSNVIAFRALPEAYDAEEGD